MDNIAYINGVAAMAYQGAMPWHMLGTQMPEKVDVAAALNAASLDWNVYLHQIALVPDRMRALPHLMHQSNYKLIENRFAVVRDIDEQVLGIVTDKYVPVQNSEAFGILNTACEKFGVEIETAGALGKGERVWMLAKMPDSIEPIPGDRIEGYFLISTGHNGSIPLTARLTPIRVVCNNTLNIAMYRNEAFIRLEHVRSDVGQLKLVEELISSLVQSLKITGESFTELAAKKMSYEEVFHYVNQVIGNTEVNSEIYKYLEIPEKKTSLDKRQEAILKLVWSGKGAKIANAGASKCTGQSTAWAAYNAVVEYVDHVRTMEGKSDKTKMAANKSALFGPNARMKERAFALAIAA